MGAFTVDEFNQLPNASDLGVTDSGIECTRFTMVNQVPVFNVFATSSRALQSLKVSNSTISDEFLFLVANVLNRLSLSLCKEFTLSRISLLLSDTSMFISGWRRFTD
ncbi:hypothetical protein P3S67_030940 [Capsicum chacoense]